MGRKKQRTRLERDILVQLEEAGSEEVTVVLNSLDPVGKDYPARELVLGDFERAIRNLTSLGDVKLVYADRGYLPVPPEDVLHLLDMRTWLTWEVAGGYWKASSSTPVIAIALAAGAS